MRAPLPLRCGSVSSSYGRSPSVAGVRRRGGMRRRSGPLDGPRRRRWRRRRRRKAGGAPGRQGGAGDAIQGEAAAAALQQADPIRGPQAKRREAPQSQGEHGPSRPDPEKSDVSRPLTRVGSILFRAVSCGGMRTRD